MTSPTPIYDADNSHGPTFMSCIIGNYALRLVWKSAVSPKNMSGSLSPPSDLSPPGLFSTPHEEVIVLRRHLHVSQQHIDKLSNKSQKRP